MNNPPEVQQGMMDGLTLYGFVAVSAMVAFYALEDRHSVFVLLFAAACALASIYGFLAGAWPFGVVEAIWGNRRGSMAARPG